MDEKKVREAIELIKSKIRILEKLENYGSAIEERKKEKHIGLYNTAIEALEKQLAKKPIEVNDAYTPKIGEFRVAKCPNCGHEVSDRFDVCLDCGQKLDWTEQESEINA